MDSSDRRNEGRPIVTAQEISLFFDVMSLFIRFVLLCLTNTPSCSPFPLIVNDSEI